MHPERDPAAADEIGRVNRLYAVLSKVNEAIVRIREPQELYEAACRIAVEDGQFLLAWIGFVEPETLCIRPAAQYGADDGYLDNVSLSLDGTVPEGRGPTGVSLREGRAFINNDTKNNPVMRPWRDAQLKRGYRSSASFPLKAEGRTVGVITLYAGEADYFDDEEIRLLMTLADDFSFALQSAATANASRELARTRLLQDVAIAASTSTSVAETCDRCLQAAARHLDLQVGAVYTYDPREQSLDLLVSFGLHGDVIESVAHYDVRTDQSTLATRAARERRLLASEDLPASAARHRLLKRAGMDDLRAIAAPLESGGTLLGTLSLIFTNRGVFSDSERDLVRALSAVVSQAFENARLYEQLMESEARFHALFTTMAEGFSLNEIILDDDGAACDFRYLEVNAAFEQFTGIRAADAVGKTMLELFPGAENTWVTRYGEVALTGEPDHWDARFGPLDRFFEVSVYQTEPGRFATVFFDVTERMSMYESMQEAARLSDALNSAGAVVHSSLDIDEVMQHALDTGVTVLGCDAGAIEMFESPEWVIRYQNGFSPETTGVHLTKEQASVATLAASRGVPFAIDDIKGNKVGDVGFVHEHGLKSLLAVPLFGKGAVIGCALFYASSAVKRFTEAEVDFGRKLGSAVALALENARLYRTEREIAHVLQAALLTLPDTVHGIEFANSYSSATDMTDVGGDFYDIFELNDDDIGITIGDISGKGLDAAVLTSLVKNTIHAFASETGKSPARVLTQANDVVYRSTPAEVFATVFFAILDRRTGRIVCANAGHTEAALARGDGTFVRLETTGPLLGAFPAVEYGDSEARLGLDELLFLYTDGLTEARRAGELYGEERLFALLATTERDSASDVVATVLSDVTSFAGNILRDDLAILAIRRSRLDGRC